MNKIMKSIVLVAAAVMTLASCQKNEIEGVEKETISGLTFVSEKPAFDDETKTEWNGTTIQWSKDDAIRIGYTCDGVWQNADGSATADEANGSKTAKLYASSKLADATASAKFSVPGNFKGTAAGKYEFYGVYPSGACVNGTDFTYAPSVTVKIPAAQTPAADSFDSAADIMVAKSPSTYTGIPTDPISLEWTRLVAHGYFTLKELALTEGETLSSITLTANAEADMVGNHYVYLDTYNVTKPNSNSAANALTINAANLTADADGNVTFWASFLPCTWTSVTVVVETDKATYTREIDLSSNQKTFAKNARNKLAIGMSTATREEKVIEESDYSGTYVILTYRDSEEKYFYLTGEETSSSTVRLVAVDAGATLPEADQEAEPNKVWNVIKSGDKYLLQSAMGEYVAYTDYGENSADMAAIGAEFTLVKDAETGTYQFTLKDGENVDRYLSLNNNIGSDYYAMYKEGQKANLYLIPATLGEVAPVISAATPEEISATGGNGSFAYTVTYPVDGRSVTASTDATWITGLAAADGVVTYTVEENTVEESRSAVVTLSYEGAESVNVTITQAAKLPEGTTEWVLTSFANLKAGDQVVIVATKGTSTYALANDNGTSDAPEAVTGITYSNNKLTAEPVARIIWYVGVSGNYRVFYADAGQAQWLYCTGSNNGVRVGTNAANAFTFESDYLKHVGTGRYVGVYTTNPDWRCYTSINSNITGQTFDFFVKTGESGGTDPEPEEPAEPETPTYESLEDLVAAGAPSTTATKVNVTLENEEITEIFVTNQGYRNGVFLQAGDREIEIYCYNVPEEWVVGGTVSGTLTECDWKLYNDIWELCPEDWSELSYTAPVKTLTSIAVSGQTTEFTVGDTFEFGGIVTATYSDGSTADVTSSATFSGYNMNAEGSQTVTVTCEGKTTTYTITITAAQGGGDSGEIVNYNEMFSSYTDGSSSNSKKVNIVGDACTWTGVGVTTAYWGNFTWGNYSTGVTFLKPSSGDAVYLVSETLSGGISHLSIAAASNSTTGTIQVSVINVDNNQEQVLGTLKTTSKKTKFTGEWDVVGVTGNYQVKITNHTTAAYVNVTDISWQ